MPFRFKLSAAIAKASGGGNQESLEVRKVLPWKRGNADNFHTNLRLYHPTTDILNNYSQIVLINWPNLYFNISGTSFKFNGFPDRSKWLWPAKAFAFISRE